MKDSEGNLNNNYQDLLDEINKLKIIDVHEHIMTEEERNRKNFFYFFPHYVNTDIVTAGMDLSSMDKLINSQEYSLDEIENFFKYWEKAKNTTQSKALLRGIKEIFGFDDVNIKNYKEVEKTFNKSKVSGFYEKILNKANIEKIVTIYIDENMDRQLDVVDRKFFMPVAWFDFFLKLFKQGDIERIQKETDVSIHRLDDLLKAYDVVFEKKVINKNAAAIKLSIAYTRSLEIKKRTKYEAEECFNKLFDKSIINQYFLDDEQGVPQREMVPLQDYLLHYILKFAESIDIPVKIHTGLQERDNYITNSNPTLLLEIFKEYKKVRFDILHGGYPYINEMICIGKEFQNVFIDMSWLHVISPTAAKHFLNQLIEAVPSNKVFGFGGDYFLIEGAYGALQFAKENIARVLQQKISEGYFNAREALNYARKILYDNH